jgi:hypothetical protein
MSASVAVCEQTARESGLAAGLAQALDRVPVAEVAPGAYAAVPADRPNPSGPPMLHNTLADAEGIAFLPCPGPRPGGTPDQLEVARRLAGVRLGVVRRVLDHVVGVLSERTSGGEPLIRKQLVIGDIADVLGGIEFCRTLTYSAASPSALTDLHWRLGELGWTAARLAGSSGYLLDHPARAVHACVLVANTWVVGENAVPPPAPRVPEQVLAVAR